MMYLIIQETTFKNIDSLYNVINYTSDINKANDMLQGYKLVEKNEDVSYSIVKYETPLILEREAVWVK